MEIPRAVYPEPAEGLGMTNSEGFSPECYTEI